MRVDEFLVNPRARLLRELADIQLARGEHHLPGLSANFVAININVLKIVVGANLLYLSQGVAQGRPIPEADVVERRLIVSNLEARNRGVRIEVSNLDAFEFESLARPVDIVLDVWSLASQLIRLDDEALHVSWNQHSGDDINENRQGDRADYQAELASGQSVKDDDDGGDDERDGDNRQSG